MKLITTVIGCLLVTPVFSQDISAVLDAIEARKASVESMRAAKFEAYKSRVAAIQAISSEKSPFDEGEDWYLTLDEKIEEGDFEGVNPQFKEIKYATTTTHTPYDNHPHWSFTTAAFSDESKFVSPLCVELYNEFDHFILSQNPTLNKANYSDLGEWGNKLSKWAFQNIANVTYSKQVIRWTATDTEEITEEQIEDLDGEKLVELANQASYEFDQLKTHFYNVNKSDLVADENSNTANLPTLNRFDELSMPSYQTVDLSSVVPFFQQLAGDIQKMHVYTWFVNTGSYEGFSTEDGGPNPPTASGYSTVNDLNWMPWDFPLGSYYYDETLEIYHFGYAALHSGGENSYHSSPSYQVLDKVSIKISTDSNWGTLAVNFTITDDSEEPSVKVYAHCVTEDEEIVKSADGAGISNFEEIRDYKEISDVAGIKEGTAESYLVGRPSSGKFYFDESEERFAVFNTMYETTIIPVVVGDYADEGLAAWDSLAVASPAPAGSWSASASGPIRFALDLGRGVGSQSRGSLIIRAQHGDNNSDMAFHDAIEFVGSAEDFGLAYDTSEENSQAVDYPMDLATFRDQSDAWNDKGEFIRRWKTPRLKEIVGRDLTVKITNEGALSQKIQLFRAGKSLAFNTITIKNQNSSTAIPANQADKVRDWVIQESGGFEKKCVFEFLDFKKDHWKLTTSSKAIKDDAIEESEYASGILTTKVEQNKDSYTIKDYDFGPSVELEPGQDANDGRLKSRNPFRLSSKIEHSNKSKTEITYHTHTFEDAGEESEEGSTSEDSGDAPKRYSVKSVISTTP